MKIQAYQEKNQADVISLWAECGLIVPQNDPVKDIERKLKVDRDLFLVGVLGQEIVASVMGGYDGHRGWINYLAVKPSMRRKGYGLAIMHEVESKIHAKGCPKINLQIRNTNSQVIAFYTAMGYGDDKVIGLGKRFDSDL